MRFSRCCLVIAVCCGSIVHNCLSQTPAPDHSSPELPVPHVDGMFLNPIPDAPFSGVVEVVSKQKSQDGSVTVLRMINLVARDSQGRTYTESRRLVSPLFKGESPLQTSHIFDPTTGLYTRLDPYIFVARQSIRKEPMKPSPDTVPVPDVSSADASIKNEDLGTQTFQGLTLHGVRQTKGPVVNDEFWYSPDLSVYMIRKHQDADWELTLTLTKLDRSEPDPARFSVPPDYKIVTVASQSADSPPSGPQHVPGMPDVYTVGRGVSAPVVIHSENPKYTDRARSAKLNGICVVSLVVDINGSPQNVHVVRTLGMGLDESAVEAVRRYRFKPAMFDGKPVPVVVNLEVKFQIY